MPVTQQLRRRALRVGAEIADEVALFSLLAPLIGPNEARAESGEKLEPVTVA